METLVSGNWEIKLLNARNGDPGAYAFSKITGEALLFDLGSLENISPKELLKVSTVLISHSHMDHFYGFDRLLRVTLPHFKKIHFAGPVGIAAAISQKLSSYTWNLIEPSQIDYLVTEVDVRGQAKTYQVASVSKFQVNELIPSLNRSDPGRNTLPTPSFPVSIVTILNDGMRIEAVALDHGISSVAYCLQSPISCRLCPDGLIKNNLKSGAWIGDLKKKYLSSSLRPSIFSIDGRNFVFDDLVSDLFISEVSRPIAYATDLDFHRDNLDRLFSLAYGAELLLCESNYLQDERELAERNRHLTTYQAALITSYLRCRCGFNFHFSKKYGSSTYLLIDEYLMHLKKLEFRADGELEIAIEREFGFKLF